MKTDFFPQKPAFARAGHIYDDMALIIHNIVINLLQLCMI